MRAGPLIDWAHKAGAWVHVDGAFGLYAMVSSRRRHLVEAFAQADSWATDCHKWLNVSYDCGLALVRHASALRGALSVKASYLQLDQHQRDAINVTPDCSRRARGLDAWAALRQLGSR